MEYNINSEQLINVLQNQKIKTWFDLGLFIDKFKEEKNLEKEFFSGNFDDYKDLLKNLHF